MGRRMAAAASGQLTSTAMARGLPPSGWKADLYAMQAWVYAGRTPTDIEAHGERLFATGFAEHIYGDMQRVVTGLIERGVEVWIASASHRALVIPGARRLGIDPARLETAGYGIKQLVGPPNDPRNRRVELLVIP